MKSFYHFSHEHQLEQTRSPPPKENISCSGCKLKILSDKDFYTCKTCPFFLHQVCYNMPRKTQHPAHPNHYLTLHSNALTSNGNLQCRACGGHVNGFYYACAKIGHYYHTLCLALPLSIAVSSHTHKLKLAYSSPYDFCCDICTKPGYKIRWLYRCQICEYDTHLSCVISNGKEQFSLQHSITPFPNTSTTRQSSYFSTALAGIDRPLDYIGEANELMQLVTQAVVVAGGDYQGLQCQRPSPSTPGSEDLSINPSYQFSDACFSIDLERSYSNYNQANIQAINHQVAKTNIPEVHGANFRHVNTGIPNMKLMKQPSFTNGTTTIYPLNVGPAEVNRMKEAFLIRSGSALACDELVQKEKMKRKAKENKLKLGPGNDQITKSDAVMSSRSSWQNLLSCCYYNPKA